MPMYFWPYCVCRSKELKTSYINRDCFSWCINNCFWFMIKKNLLGCFGIANEIESCHWMWCLLNRWVSGYLQPRLSNAQEWSVHFPEHCLYRTQCWDHMNVYCYTLNITNRNVDSITAVFEHLIFDNMLKSTYYDVVWWSLFWLVRPSHWWHMWLCRSSDKDPVES